MMEGASSIALSGIVLEPLSRDNYLDWSTLVENYLAGQDLWDDIIVNVPTDNDSDWKVKNRRALHVIQLACGNRNLPYVRHCKTAQDAWNSLSALFSKGRFSAYSGLRATEPVQDINPFLYSVKNGSWEPVNMFIMIHPDAIFYTFNRGENLLHIAVKAGQEKMVNKLVEKGKQPLLTMQDEQGYTALALAAELTDNTKIAECMVRSEGGSQLLIQNNSADEIPVLLASAKGHKRMTRYLFNNTPWFVLENSGRYASMLLSRCISAEIFDVALELLQHPNAPLFNLAPADESCSPPIYAIACIPSAFRSGTQLNWTQLFIYYVLRIPTFKGGKGEKETDFKIEIIPPDEPREGTNKGALRRSSPMRYLGQIFGQVQQFFQTSILLKSYGIRKIYELKMKHYLVHEIVDYFSKRVEPSDGIDLKRWYVYDAILQATKHGIIEFIDSMRAANSDLLWTIDKNKRGILAHAIINRQEKVFNLIKEIDEIEGQKEMFASLEDVFGNNILHLAVEFNPFSTNGAKSNATLQILREFHWLKAVERIAPPTCRESKNKLGYTPRELFTISRRQVMKESEQWLKDISTTSITIGTVIITLMFTAAITVPGGNDQSKGTPTFLGQRAFTFFAIADAISLITSMSSALTFVSILISSYADQEKLFRRLPIKLLFGFITLFFSVSSMMFAFYAALVSSLKGYRNLLAVALVLTIIPILVLLPSLLRLSFQILKVVTRFDFLTTKKKKIR